MPPSSRDAEPSLRLQGKPSEASNRANAQLITYDTEQENSLDRMQGWVRMSDLQWRVERKDISTFPAREFASRNREHGRDRMGHQGKGNEQSRTVSLHRLAPRSTGKEESKEDEGQGSGERCRGHGCGPARC
jgi:hypothetical protein